MRPEIVVVGPVGNGAAAMIEAKEQALIEKLVTHGAVETMDIAVCIALPGAAGRISGWITRHSQIGKLQEEGYRNRSISRSALVSLFNTNTFGSQDA